MSRRTLIFSVLSSLALATGGCQSAVAPDELGAFETPGITNPTGDDPGTLGGQGADDPAGDDNGGLRGGGGPGHGGADDPANHT
jgi:hypothetical protein